MRPINSLRTTRTSLSPASLLRHHQYSLAPRSYLFTARRTFTSTLRPLQNDSSSSSSNNSPFGSAPSPPRLPKEDQDLFESLQRHSTGAFSSPRSSPPKINQSLDSSSSSSTQPAATTTTTNSTSTSGEAFKQTLQNEIAARGKGDELHPNVRKGAPPEFEGEVNPRTGEVGGPKNEPLRWGAGGEWSYNGRTTDF